MVTEAETPVPAPDAPGAESLPSEWSIFDTLEGTAPASADDTTDIAEMLPPTIVEDDAPATDGEAPSDDAEADAPTFVAPENWQETEGGKAFLAEWSKNRDERTLGDALDVFSGKREEKSVSAPARRAARSLQAAVEMQSLAAIQVDHDKIDSAFNRWMPLETLWRADPDNDSYSERINSDPNLRTLWNEWAGWAQQNGVSPNSFISEAREAVRENHRKFNLHQLRESYRDFNPEAVYQDYQDSDEWSDLTAEQQAALDPDQFTGTAMQRIRAMERKFGAFQASLSDGRKRKDAIARAEAVNHTADAARLRAATEPPQLQGAPPRNLTDAQIQAAYIQAQETDSLTPDLEAAFYRVQQRKRGGGGWV